MDKFLGILFIVVCVLLILIVLLQKGRGGGLGAAFGGAGSSAFGTRTGDVFTWVTIVLTALFLVLAVVTTLVCKPDVLSVGALAVDRGGPISSEMTVQIQCELTQGVSIAYTTDGSDPIQDDATLGQFVNVVVKPGQTLKAQAYLKGRSPSKMLVVEYARAEATTQPAIPVQPAEQPATAPAM